MAIEWDILKTRYLQYSPAAQIDNLALNFLRLQVLTRSGTDESAAQHLVRESQFLIEWTVPRIDLGKDMAFATELVDLQRLLSQWKSSWPELWQDGQARHKVSVAAQDWSDRLQKKSKTVESSSIFERAS
jgi:hypothetical protein